MATGANTNRRAETSVRRFGSFELDLDSERLLKNGRTIRIQPQPFRLLCLLTNRPGALITREEIQAALWAGDTFVDFDQGVNFAIKQVREALGDRAEDSLYVQTVPKRGYRFLAPVEAGPEPVEPIVAGSVDPYLQKALWANIVELRLAEKRRNQQVIVLTGVLAFVVIILIALLFNR
jgi:DNA-binding winged helix-turn-helix (wHTH) protein